MRFLLLTIQKKTVKTVFFFRVGQRKSGDEAASLLMIFDY
jgi:hypothetical protein